MHIIENQWLVETGMHFFESILEVKGNPFGPAVIGSSEIMDLTRVVPRKNIRPFHGANVVFIIKIHREEII